MTSTGNFYTHCVYVLRIALRDHPSASTNSPWSEHVKDFNQEKKPVDVNIFPVTVIEAALRSQLCVSYAGVV
jgi:hypothetical protein